MSQQKVAEYRTLANECWKRFHADESDEGSHARWEKLAKEWEDLADREELRSGKAGPDVDSES